MVNGNGAQQETNGILCRVHGSGTTALLRGYTIRMEEDSLHQRHRHQYQLSWKPIQHAAHERTWLRQSAHLSQHAIHCKQNQLQSVTSRRGGVREGGEGRFALDREGGGRSYAAPAGRYRASKEPMRLISRILVGAFTDSDEASRRPRFRRPGCAASHLQWRHRTRQDP